MRVHLRKRVGKLSEENKARGKKQMSSLYLIYQQNVGDKLKYEWLNLHIYETPKTNLEKDHNKATQLLAESIKSKRLLDIQAQPHGFVSGVRGKVSFLEYFKTLVDKKFDESAGNYGNWKSTYEHLRTFFDGNNYSLAQIDEVILEGFKEHLFKNIKRKGKGKLHQNTAMSYFNKVRAALRQAYLKKMISETPMSRVKGIQELETARQYLTLEELKALSATACENALLKKAFLFSALTGLRFGDVKALTWDKIKYSDSEQWNIHFTQQKTKGVEVLPVSEQAITLLGEKNDKGEAIFKNLTYHTWMNSQLQEWIKRAGISKKITFHCARHSFATLQLSLDTDIYTVSKLLGHKNIKTTQIYAKVIDKKKVDAVARIPSFL